MDLRKGSLMLIKVVLVLPWRLKYGNYINLVFTDRASYFCTPAIKQIHFDTCNKRVYSFVYQ